MKKALILILLLLIIFSAFVILTKGEERISYDYTHTKAICQGNSCQDFLITCSDNELVEMVPLTGLVTFSDDWEDRRSDDEKRLC
ncbi:hypothetical protein AUJ84_04105 [Candidatus Pacearchaeota archaeon CG1_02_32_132]|nr:MAG: hypothetical protein AUJ84_04105 [Candidatus Pacearchaeota archaeon CG1_02_32_132]